MSLRTSLQRAASIRLRSFQPARRQLAILSPTASTQPLSPQEIKKTTTTTTTTEKETIVEFHEHCNTGSDREAAELKYTAYGKTTTKPDEEMVAAEEESKKLGHESNPLDVSSANPQSSEIRDSSLEGSLPDDRLPSQGMLKGVTTKQGHCKKYG